MTTDDSAAQNKLFKEDDGHFLYRYEKSNLYATSLWKISRHICAWAETFSLHSSGCALQLGAALSVSFGVAVKPAVLTDPESAICCYDAMMKTAVFHQVSSVVFLVAVEFQEAQLFIFLV